jgi:hypothetical protein
MFGHYMLPRLLISGNFSDIKIQPILCALKLSLFSLRSSAYILELSI